MLCEISNLQTGRVTKARVQRLQALHSLDATTSQPVSTDDSTGARLFPSYDDDSDSDSASSVSSEVCPVSTICSRPVRATAFVAVARFPDL